MKIGILTGGGDCPGLNAVIRAVMKVINTYRCMTSTTDLNPKVQAYRAEQRRKEAEESEESEADLKNPEKHWTF